MIIKENYNLKNNNTFHISAKVQKLYIPSTEKELLDIITKIKNEEYYILSGGSNILLNDKKIYKNIIYMEDVDKNIEHISEGTFYIGCSNRIQTVINYINKCGYGGIEKLYTLPALFGGIIYMNAGIGSYTKPLFTISDYIESVKVIDKKDFKIKWLDKEKCNFSHRRSIFQDNNYIILGARCKFNKQNIDVSKDIIKCRIEDFNKKVDYGKGTFGSIFSISNNKLLRIASIIWKGRSIRFGKNNSNWLVNTGEGTFTDTMYLINKCKKIHKLFRKKCELEVVIWD